VFDDLKDSKNSFSGQAMQLLRERGQSLQFWLIGGD
jgi:hypothetical protein